MFQLLAQHRRVNSQLLSDLVSKFIANNAAWNPLNVGQEIIYCLNFAFCAADWKLSARPLDQVVKISLRVLEGFGVSVFALAADKQIRIQASAP